jgi:hypothetical protein
MVAYVDVGRLVESDEIEDPLGQSVVDVKVEAPTLLGEALGDSDERSDTGAIDERNLAHLEHDWAATHPLREHLFQAVRRREVKFSFQAEGAGFWNGDSSETHVAFLPRGGCKSIALQRETLGLRINGSGEASAHKAPSAPVLPVGFLEEALSHGCVIARITEKEAAGSKVQSFPNRRTTAASTQSVTRW